MITVTHLEGESFRVLVDNTTYLTRKVRIQYNEVTGERLLWGYDKDGDANLFSIFRNQGELTLPYKWVIGEDGFIAPPPGPRVYYIWERDDAVTIKEVKYHGGRGHVFDIYVHGDFIATVTPRDGLHMLEMRNALDAGESVLDWEDGNGKTISSLLEAQ